MVRSVALALGVCQHRSPFTFSEALNFSRSLACVSCFLVDLTLPVVLMQSGACLLQHSFDCFFTRFPLLVRQADGLQCINGLLLVCDLGAYLLCCDGLSSNMFGLRLLGLFLEAVSAMTNRRWQAATYPLFAKTPSLCYCIPSPPLLLAFPSLPSVELLQQTFESADGAT